MVTLGMQAIFIRGTAVTVQLRTVLPYVTPGFPADPFSLNFLPVIIVHTKTDYFKRRRTILLFIVVMIIMNVFMDDCIFDYYIFDARLRSQIQNGFSFFFLVSQL